MVCSFVCCGPSSSEASAVSVTAVTVSIVTACVVGSVVDVMSVECECMSVVRAVVNVSVEMSSVEFPLVLGECSGCEWTGLGDHVRCSAA